MRFSHGMIDKSKKVMKNMVEMMLLNIVPKAITSYV